LCVCVRVGVCMIN